MPQHQLLSDPHRAVAGVGQGMIEDRRLDLGRHPIGVRSPGPGQLVEQPVGAVGLKVAPDLVGGIRKENTPQPNPIRKAA
jgi:hypothetical protein